jgi:hypothetical protein
VVGANSPGCSGGADRQFCGGASTAAPSSAAACHGQRGSYSIARALLRPERSGLGDGRVYHVSVTATDPDGLSCSGVVTTCVPHDQSLGAMCVDQGPLYNSLVCTP